MREMWGNTRVANRFSAVEAALEGFRLIRRAPAAVAVWTGLHLIGGLVGLVLTFGLMGPTMAEMGAMTRGGAFDGAAFGRFMRGMGLVSLVSIPLSLAWMSIAWTAVYRAVLRPQDSAFFYLRFSKDEWRQFLVMLLMTLVVIGGVGGVAGVVGLGMFGSGPGGILIGLVGWLVGVGLLLFLMVRMALIPAKTLTDRRVQFSAAWRMTRGHFWGIFGAYALTVVLLFVIGLATQLTVSTLSGGVMNQVSVDMSRGALDTLGFVRTHPVQLAIYWLASSVVNTLQLVILLAPGAAIYKAMAGKGTEIAETFA